MYYNKHILEAVHKGIQLALDDYEDNDLNNDIRSKDEIIKNDEEILHRIVNVVDMGLHSRTLWAKYNIGVNSTKLNKWEDWQGQYFAFGEISPKEVYNWKTYKWGGDENAYKMDEYILKYGKPSDKELELYDDAVYMNTRGVFITPTDEQYKELLKHSKVEYIIPKDGVKYDGHQLYTDGYLFTSKINGNQLFFPCADIKSDVDTTNFNLHQNEKNVAYYWTRSLYNPGTDFGLTEALHLFFSHGEMNTYVSSFDRCAGLPVRGVLYKK